MRLTWPLLVTISLFFLATGKNDAYASGPQDNLGSEVWKSDVLAGLALKEYSIQYDALTRTASSPNRARNLRIQYTANGFSIEPRVSDMLHWNAEFRLKGIYRGEVLAYQPDASPQHTVEDQSLVFTYTDPFQVEYINDANGMRQNFLIQEKPAGTQELRICMEINASLAPELIGDQELAFYNPQTLITEPQARYSDLKVWDSNGIALKAHMELTEKSGQHMLALVVNDKHATYPITVDPVSTGVWDTEVEQDQANAQFGISVSTAGDINGDGFSDVMVGANAYDNGVADEGAVFIFHGSPSGISTSPDAVVEGDQNGCNFGFATSTAGDVNGDGFSDIIVGAPTWSAGQINEGAFWVYYGSASGLVTTTTTFMESNMIQTSLGLSVSSAGDVNNDGFSDVLVGIPALDNGETDEGGFYLFMGASSGLQIGSPILVESNQADAQFGNSVSGAGDVNGDGYSDILIGSHLYDHGQTDEGSVFLYLGSSGGIQLPAADTIDNNVAGSWFGYSVCNAGDINGDGYSDIGIGAYLYESGEFQEGAVYVYEGNATGVEPAPGFFYQSNTPSSRLGAAVSTAGDVNGDGFADFMVSSRRYSNPSPSEGGTFIFFGSDAGLPSVPSQILESNQTGAEMGIDISCAGDVNGDGISDVIIGCFLYDNPQSNEGVAWVYHGSPDGLSVIPSIMEPNQASARMGSDVSNAGDVNGDGFSDMIVGVQLYDNGQGNEGAAFVYHGSANGFSNTPSTILEGNLANARFGTAVSAAGDVNGDGYSDVVVGAPSFTGGQVGEGAVYLFHGSPTGLSTTPALILQSNSNGAQMGNSVAGIGDVNGDGYGDVAMGAWFYDGTFQNEGKVFVHHGSVNGIEAIPAFTFESNQAQGFLGVSVAGAGDVNGDGYSDFLASAYRYDNPTPDEGVVFVFHGSSTGLTGPTGILESNQASALFGTEVASAGDVNGDGFSDVLVGAERYDSPQTDEGVVHVYYGSISGLGTSPNVVLQEDQAGALFGHSVGSAGDVNGDGYNDVIIGAYNYDNGQTNEGVTYLYLGGVSGLSTINEVMLESDQASSNFGWQVSSAGDINGDGYSEVVIGARGWDGGFSDEGGAFVYYGNTNGNRTTLTRQYRADLVTPLANNSYHWGSPGTFGIGKQTISHNGRVTGKLVWEKVAEGQPFSGTPITNSTSFTSESSTWTDLGLNGTEIKEVASVVPMRTRWRVRVKYHPCKAIDGQMYSRWYYGVQNGAEDIGLLPVELTNFTANPEGTEQVRLNWASASESGVSEYVIERSGDANHFESIGSQFAYGGHDQEAEYESYDQDPLMGTSYYRLRMEDQNGGTEYSEIEKVVLQRKGSGIVIYPNPVSEVLFVRVSNAEAPVQVKISDIKGNTVHNSMGETGQKARVIEVGKFSSGIYMVEVRSGLRSFTEKVVVRTGSN